MTLFSSWLAISKFHPHIPCLTQNTNIIQRRFSPQRRWRNTPRQPSRPKRTRPASLLAPQTPASRNRPPHPIHPNPPHNPRPPPPNPLPQPNLPPNHQRPPPHVPRPIAHPPPHPGAQAHARMAHHHPQHRRVMDCAPLRYKAVPYCGASYPEYQMAVYKS